MIDEMKAAKGQSLSEMKETKIKEPKQKPSPAKVEHHEVPKRDEHIER